MIKSLFLNEKIIVVCLFCQTLYIDDMFFCNEHVTCLIEEEEKRETFLLEEEFLSPASNVPVEALAPSIPPAMISSMPPTILVEIVEQNRSLENSLTKTIYIGRIDPAANIYPEIDLSTENCLEYGISQQHIRILYRGRQVFVENLGSINSTTINSRRLLAYLPEPLASGDSLTLGRLNIIIRIQPQ